MSTIGGGGRYCRHLVGSRCGKAWPERLDGRLLTGASMLFRFRFGIAVRLWLVPAGDTPGHAQATDLLAAQDPALVQARAQVIRRRPMTTVRHCRSPT